MATLIDCPNCHRSLSTKRSLRGLSKIRRPNCGAVFAPSPVDDDPNDAATSTTVSAPSHAPVASTHQTGASVWRQADDQIVFPREPLYYRIVGAYTKFLFYASLITLGLLFVGFVIAVSLTLFGVTATMGEQGAGTGIVGGLGVALIFLWLAAGPAAALIVSSGLLMAVDVARNIRWQRLLQEHQSGLL